MVIVVPYRSHGVVRLLETCWYKPDVLFVLVPGRWHDESFLEVAPDVVPEDIPHILSVPSHLVPVDAEGKTDGCVLRRGDSIFLANNAPTFMVLAATRLAADIDPGAFCLVEGKTITTIAR